MGKQKIELTMVLQEKFLKQGNWLFRHRGILPLPIVLVGLVVYLRGLYLEQYHCLFTTDCYDLCLYSCVFISLIGFCIRIYTVGHAPDNTSDRNTKKQVAETLNTTGMYSIVRHPLYLGNFFTWLGLILFVGNFWFAVSVCFLFWLYYERIMYAEESFLMDKFGKAYLHWANKTPAFFPDFKLFVNPITSFRWKKVLRKEKNGMLIVFMIFSLYDLIYNFMLQKNDINYIIISICAFFILVNVILKILRHKPVLFNKKNR